MNYYQSIFQYNGSQYKGFQFQKDCPTIQSEINMALKKLLNCHISTKGTSRTDTGVHALKQIVKITSEEPILLSQQIDQLNCLLPDDIICLDVCPCASSFQPNRDVSLKEYRYFFTNYTNSPSDLCSFIVNFSPRLDFALIEKCLTLIQAENDFCNFYSSGSNVSSTKRTITRAEIKSINPHELFQKSNLFIVPKEIQSCFEFKIEGHGFLKQMNRHLVSALWKVGSGQLSISEFHSLLNGPKANQQLWKVAYPNGLFLWDIHTQSAVIHS